MIVRVDLVPHDLFTCNGAIIGHKTGRGLFNSAQNKSAIDLAAGFSCSCDNDQQTNEEDLLMEGDIEEGTAHLQHAVRLRLIAKLLRLGRLEAAS
jgi:hypothetical protein